MTFTRGKMAVFALAALALTATPNASDAWAQNDRPNKQSPSPASRSLQQRLIGQSQDDDAGLAKSTLSTPSPNAPLIGRWRQRDEIAQRELVFLPDGRYFSVQTPGSGQPQREMGTYQVKGSSLTLTPVREASVSYVLGFQGERLILGGPALGGKALAWDKEPGSEKSIIVEAQQLDALRAAQNEAWRARIPAGPIQPGPWPFGGEAPADSQWTRAFAGATVFAEPEIYLWLAPTAVQLTNPGGLINYGEGRDSVKCFFFPNGRCFFKLVSWAGSTDLNGRETAAWGAYRLETSQGPTERLYLITDADEQLVLDLEEGRRNLSFGSTLLSNIEWEHEP
jgi:hypothetical protein